MSLKFLIPLLLGGSLLYGGILLFWPKLAITILLLAVGFSMVWKTVWWLSFFGRNPWAEEHLAQGLGSGFGGSWLFYKLLGIATMVAALLYLTGGLQTILVRTLGTFFGAHQE